jgi:hypothetical protein
MASFLALTETFPVGRHMWPSAKARPRSAVKNPASVLLLNHPIHSARTNITRTRFRDTFGVELLLSGALIERVSILLGRRSVRMTEKHYARWVRSRQEQLEADLV